jgi:hypothetical protein
MDLKPTESVEESFKISTISGEGIAQVLKAAIDIANSAHTQGPANVRAHKVAES